MTVNWLRRAVALAAFASVALLAGCGSGTIESQLAPSRIISMGDGLSDVGQTSNAQVANARYTVNDGGVNIWAQQLAASYGQSLTAASAGGLGYAQGNARVTAKPDAAGSSATLTVKEQIDTFLAASPLGPNDVVLVNGGISDIVAGMMANPATVVATAQQAGTDLGAQVRRLVQAGGKHVVVAGVYDLGRSPWAVALGQTALLSQASTQFNSALLVSIVDLGADVLYVDMALDINLVTSSPTVYGFTDATTVVCTSVDAGAGIGTGAGQVNSALCTTATIAAGLDYNKFVFADRVYFTPAVHRQFGVYAFDKVRARW